MYRDITNVPTDTNCIRIIDDKSIVVYTNTDTSTYNLISYKYYKIDKFDANTPPTYVNCYTTAQIATLPSPFDFITPVYYGMAMISAILIFYFSYRLILHPFWRKK